MTIGKRQTTIRVSSTLRGEDKGEGEGGNKFKSLKIKKLESYKIYDLRFTIYGLKNEK